jgi:hypothetical protein
MNTTPPPATSLLEVRDFLLAHSAAPAPWSSASAAIDALYALLRARRADPAFWTDLEGLLHRLEDARVRRSLIRGGELLDGATVGALLADLREALPALGSGPTSARSWSSGASAAGALAAFLLLGTAVGCAPMGAEAQFDSDCADAEEFELDEYHSETYCELVFMVDSADVSSSVRADVLDCLPGLSAAYRENLVEVFRTYSDLQLTRALEALAGSDECEDDWGDDDDNDNDDH